MNLLKILEDEFKEKGDMLIKGVRGSLGPDIIHNIRTPAGGLLENKIGYDNKEGSITNHDIEKAKRDKKKLGLDHFIIVSSNLPKWCKNQFYGEKDGILLVHPDIVTALTSEIRKLSVELSRQSGSMVDRQTKEAKTYELVRSPEFNSYIEAICEIHRKSSDFLKKDRKHHETSWKEQEKMQKDLTDTYVHLRSAIDSITQPESRIDNKNNPEVKDRADISKDGRDSL